METPVNHHFPSFPLVKKEKLQIETPMTDVDQNLLKLHKLTQLPAPGTQENGCSCCAAAANVWSQKYPKNDFPSTDFWVRMSLIWRNILKELHHFISAETEKINAEPLQRVPRVLGIASPVMTWDPRGDTYGVRCTCLGLNMEDTQKKTWLITIFRNKSAMMTGVSCSIHCIHLISCGLYPLVTWHSSGKSPSLIGKSTIFMGHFPVRHYQKVSPMTPASIPLVKSTSTTNGIQRSRLCHALLVHKPALNTPRTARDDQEMTMERKLCH